MLTYDAIFIVLIFIILFECNYFCLFHVNWSASLLLLLDTPTPAAWAFESTLQNYIAFCYKPHKWTKSNLLLLMLALSETDDS